MVLLLAWGICHITPSFAQRKEADSLRAVLKRLERQPSYAKDSSYLLALNAIAFGYLRINPDSSLYFAQQAAQLSDAAHLPDIQTEAWRQMGLAYSNKGEYARSLAIFAQAFALAGKQHNIKGIGRLYNNIAVVYKNQGRYPEALEMHFKSMGIKEKLGDEKGMAASLGNIANLYQNLGKYQEAEENSRRALLIFEKLGDKANITASLINLTVLYFHAGKIDDAAAMYERAYTACMAVEDDRHTMAYALNIGGLIAQAQQRYKDALALHHKSLVLGTQVGDKNGLCTSLQNIGACYLHIGQYEQALPYTQRALKLSEEMNNKQDLVMCHDVLSDIYEQMGQYKLALEHANTQAMYADSISNQETKQQIAQLQAQFAFDKKEAILKAKQAVEVAEYERRSAQNKWLLLSAVLGLVAALAAAIVFFISRRKIRQSYADLTKANAEIHRQKRALEANQAEIHALNASLQAKVNARTATLRSANKQLIDYGFSISHILRKPVATILGLVSIFNPDEALDPINLFALKNIQSGAQELDDALHAINNNLITIEELDEDGLDEAAAQ